MRRSCIESVPPLLLFIHRIGSSSCADSTSTNLRQFSRLPLRLTMCAGVAASAQEESEDNTMSWTLTLKTIRAKFPTVAHISTDTLQSWLDESPQRKKPPAARHARTRGIRRQPSAGRPASLIERRSSKSTPRSTVRPAYRFVLFRGIPLVGTCPVSNEKGIYGNLQSGRINLRLGKRGATCLSRKRAGKGRPSL